jgi:hypothetical protein
MRMPGRAREFTHSHVQAILFFILSAPAQVYYTAATGEINKYFGVVIFMRRRSDMAELTALAQADHFSNG